jgi:hypothetical protein
VGKYDRPFCGRITIRARREQITSVCLAYGAQALGGSLWVHFERLWWTLEMRGFAGISSMQNRFLQYMESTFSSTESAAMDGAFVKCHGEYAE